MTRNELKLRIGWNFAQKLDHTLGVIDQFYNATQGKVYLGFSGGKDSTVLLHIVRTLFDKNAKAVYCNTGNEYPSVINFVRTWDNITVLHPTMSVREVIEKVGFPLISKLQAKYIREAKNTKNESVRLKRLYGQAAGLFPGVISKKWQFLVNTPFAISERCCDILKKNPFHLYEKDSGLYPMTGMLAGESLLRQSNYIRRGGCNVFTEHHFSSHPLSIWTEEDVWYYIRRYNIPYCDIYDLGINRTGCAFCGFGCHYRNDRRFEILYNLYPGMYQMCMGYENSGYTYREVLRSIGVSLPDEKLHFREG